RNGDDLLFGNAAEERNLAVFHLVDAALRTCGEQDRSVRTAGDAVRHFVFELADYFDKTVGIDAIDLAAASSGRGGAGTAAVFERDADLDAAGGVFFLRLAGGGTGGCGSRSRLRGRFRIRLHGSGRRQNVARRR